MSQVFTLPDVGEGLTEAISAGRCPRATPCPRQPGARGDRLPSPRAELPSPYAGTVQVARRSPRATPWTWARPSSRSARCHHPAGGTDPGADDTVPQNGLAGADGAATADRRGPAPGPGPRGALGPRRIPVGGDAVRRPARCRQRGDCGGERTARSGSGRAQAAGTPPVPHGPAGGVVPRRPGLAKPPVRKAAKEMGIDLGRAGHG
ncbi:hypothetical protein QJS66_17555 [Kocuria rhizophila]|nr:hypothetical protein QJS66_17555 [Kocuria rhizophila]